MGIDASSRADLNLLFHSLRQAPRRLSCLLFFRLLSQLSHPSVGDEEKDRRPSGFVTDRRLGTMMT